MSFYSEIKQIVTPKKQVAFLTKTTKCLKKLVQTAKHRVFTETTYYRKLRTKLYLSDCWEQLLEQINSHMGLKSIKSRVQRFLLENGNS